VEVVYKGAKIVGGDAQGRSKALFAVKTILTCVRGSVFSGLDLVFYYR
jgi:hypothetical protein